MSSADDRSTRGQPIPLPRTVLQVFTKAPVSGQVKTRLARVIGADAALAAHRDLLVQTCTTVVEACATFHVERVELWVAGADHPDIQALADARAWPVFEQTGTDLGDRMSAAMAASFAAGAERVLLLGTDCPLMSVAMIGSALDRLAAGDQVVFAPTEDGGYVMVGTDRHYDRLFRDIHWSTSAVLQRSLEQAHGLSVGLLDVVWDVDEAEDYERWKALKNNK